MPKIIDKAEKKQHIIQAALATFAKKGVNNTKMIDIAKAAGVGKGTIYDYFRSKDAIFLEAFNHFNEEMKAEIGKRMFLLTDPKEKLITFIETSFEMWQQFSDFAEIMFDFWAEGIRERYEHIDLKRIYDDYGAYLAAILKEGVQSGVFRKMNAKMVASFVVGGMDGLALQWLIRKQKFPIIDARKEFIYTILNGIETA